MSNAPLFTSDNEYRSYRANLDFWQPHIVNILERHGLSSTDKHTAVKCGFNPTYPVFLIDDIVVKFFGHCPNWSGAFNTECIAHEGMIKDNTILAPRILAKGKLFANPNAPWPYIISSRISGQSWLDANLSYEEKKIVAEEIGQQLGKIHSLPPDKQLNHDHKWSKLNFRIAAEKSILPKHLVAQVDSFIAKLDDFDRCFVNGDIVDTHVFIENSHLSGIIDWGDATATDRHYELGKLSVGNLLYQS
jgi:hygromycin-B 7''-O-kinase